MGDSPVIKQSGKAPDPAIRQFTLERYGKAPDDFNADGAITEEDDWIQLAMHQGRFGPELGQLKADAIKFWEQQARKQHPDASRHLAYWRGTRKLARDSKAEGCFAYASARIDDPNKVGLKIVGKEVSAKKAKADAEKQITRSLDHELKIRGLVQEGKKKFYTSFLQINKNYGMSLAALGFVDFVYPDRIPHFKK